MELGDVFLFNKIFVRTLRLRVFYINCHETSSSLAIKESAFSSFHSQSDSSEISGHDLQSILVPSTLTLKLTVLGSALPSESEIEYSSSWVEYNARIPKAVSLGVKTFRSFDHFLR